MRLSGSPAVSSVQGAVKGMLIVISTQYVPGTVPRAFCAQTPFTPPTALGVCWKVPTLQARKSYLAGKVASLSHME